MLCFITDAYHAYKYKDSPFPKLAMYHQEGETQNKTEDTHCDISNAQKRILATNPRGSTENNPLLSTKGRNREI